MTTYTSFSVENVCVFLTRSNKRVFIFMFTPFLMLLMFVLLFRVVNKREASSARGLPTTRRTAGVGGQQNKEAAATAVAAAAGAGAAGGKKNSVKISNTILIRRNKRRSSSTHANSSRSPRASQRAQADHKTARQVWVSFFMMIIIFIYSHFYIKWEAESFFIFEK